MTDISTLEASPDEQAALYLPETTDTGTILLPTMPVETIPVPVPRTWWATPAEREPRRAEQHLSYGALPVLPRTRHAFLTWPERAAVIFCGLLASATIALVWGWLL